MDKTTASLWHLRASAAPPPPLPPPAHRPSSRHVGGKNQQDCKENRYEEKQVFNHLCPSGPCPPTGISTTQDCLSAIVVVTWQAGSGGLDYYYTASMQTDSGVTSMCMSDSNECSVPGLMCGHNFTVSVTASNSVCNATAAETADLQSGDTTAACRQITTLLTQ